MSWSWLAALVAFPWHLALWQRSESKFLFIVIFSPGTITEGNELNFGINCCLISNETREKTGDSQDDYGLVAILKICVHHQNHVTCKKKTQQKVRPLKVAGFHNQSPSINYDGSKEAIH